MKEEEKKHWFCMCFEHTNEGDGKLTRTIGSVYMGYPNKLITIPRLYEAKQYLEFPKDSAVTSIAYMGFAAKTQIENQH